MSLMDKVKTAFAKEFKPEPIVLKAQGHKMFAAPGIDHEKPTDQELVKQRQAARAHEDARARKRGKKR